MNKIAIITAFLGGVKNRYMQYQPEKSLREKLELAARIPGVEGVELCYPQDFQDPKELVSLLKDTGLGVSAVNVRSRRQGKWLRGSFSSSDPKERQEVVEDFKAASDAVRLIGARRITTCPLNDGHDYPFEMDYRDAYAYMAEAFHQIASAAKDLQICIEYKWNDPRTRCLLASAGETALFCASVGLPNLGVTLDFGHSILAGERPAQAAALLHQTGRLFYVHLNDNDRNWDWDMLPGAFNLLELIEFFYYLKEVGYTDDWYAYDIMSKEVDLYTTFDVAVRITRKVEKMAEKIDRKKMTDLLKKRNPAVSLGELYEWVF
ncbi:MAG: sugar phosphate isomerase/epimerase [Spirochaetales bacterium]